MDIELIEVMVCLAIGLTIAAIVPEMLVGWYFSWKRKRRLKKILQACAEKLEGSVSPKQVNDVAKEVWRRPYNLLTVEERVMLQWALKGKI